MKKSMTIKTTADGNVEFSYDETKGDKSIKKVHKMSYPEFFIMQQTINVGWLIEPW